MKKTRLLGLLSLLSVAGVAAGCDVNSSIPEGGLSTELDISSILSSISEEETKVEIEWKSTLSYTDAIDTLIADFEEEYPNIAVTYTKISGSYDTLKDNVLSAIGAAALPNVVSCYPDHVAEYLDYDIVVKLNKYIDAEGMPYAWEEGYKDGFLPGLWDQCCNFARKGIFMLPHSSSTEAMFYNETILGKVFGQANDGKPITHEYLNNITWEELMGVLAPAILEYNANNGNCFLNLDEGNKSAVVNYSGADNAFVTFSALKEVEFSKIDKATGQGVICFDDSERVMKETLKTFNGYYKENLFSTAGIEGETNINVNEKLYSVFATGSTGGIKYQVPADASFGTGVMRIPNFEGKPHKVISQGPGLCVLKSGDDAKDLASFLFIDFLNRSENSLYWSLETGYFPVRSDCYETEDYVAACDEEGKAEASLELLKAKTYSYANTVQDDFFTNIAFKGSASARTYCGALFNTVVGYQDELTDDYLDEQFANTVNLIKNKM